MSEIVQISVMPNSGEVMTQMRTKEQAEDCRDSIAKTLYARLFGWIVMMVNKNLQPADVTR